MMIATTLLKMRQIGFISKVILLSLILSFLIKYGGPMLPIDANSFNALIFISFPTLIMIILLWWRSQQTET